VWDWWDIESWRLDTKPEEAQDWAAWATGAAMKTRRRRRWSASEKKAR
jgi:hypothetical protein